MTKCNICGSKIETTFLNKIIGTTIKDIKGKKHQICFSCQKKFDNDKNEILKKI